MRRQPRRRGLVPPIEGTGIGRSGDMVTSFMTNRSAIRENDLDTWFRYFSSFLGDRRTRDVTGRWKSLFLICLFFCCKQISIGGRRVMDRGEGPDGADWSVSSRATGDWRRG